MSDLELSPPRALRRAIHRLEDDETFDRVARIVDRGAAAAGGGGVGSILRGDWLGHALHPLLTDVPLGCWTAAAVLDVTAWRRGELAARRLVGAGLLFAAPTAAAGLAEFASLTEQRSRRVAVVHAAGNAVAIGLYLASWRARRHGHHLVGTAASTLGGVVAIGTGYLGGHLSFVLGAGSGGRGRISAAIALPEHTGERQPATSAESDVIARDGRPATSAAEVTGVSSSQSGRSTESTPTDPRAGATDRWPTVEVVTPAVTSEQHEQLQQLLHYTAENRSNSLPTTSEEMHTAFRLPAHEVTLENLRALSAEASRIAGAARLLYREDDPDVKQLVEEANAG